MSTTSAAARYFEGPWYEKYLMLEEYKKKHGNCLVPQSYAIDDVKLGRWVTDQRQLYKKGKLTADRRAMLEAEALGFSWDPLADQWERNFALLEQFKEREGHSNVPNDHVEDGAKLGIWINTQRQDFKKGRLDVSYQRRLENLGMSWQPFADQWERSFALLEQFKEREGHCNVPQGHEEDGIKLGLWVAKQRARRERLDESYQRRLENLGMSWDPLAEQWERHFALLEQYCEREGHCDVPRSHEEDEVKLGIWVDTQRQVRKGKQGVLGADRIKRLDNLGIRWSFK